MGLSRQKKTQACSGAAESLECACAFPISKHGVTLFLFPSSPAEVLHLGFVCLGFSYNLPPDKEATIAQNVIPWAGGGSDGKRI